MNSTVEKLRLISKNYGIKKFIKVERGDHYCDCNGEDSYINRSFICGKDEIELGIYEDEELMIASFFHELGHITKEKVKGFFNSEEDAWIIGFELAKKHGYVFSDNTYKWCKEQLNTYKDDK